MITIKVCSKVYYLMLKDAINLNLTKYTANSIVETQNASIPFNTKCSMFNQYFHQIQITQHHFLKL